MTMLSRPRRPAWPGSGFPQLRRISAAATLEFFDPRFGSLRPEKADDRDALRQQAF
jgi:hypothetical protein